ncbi:MAG: phosphatidylglycerophosphatase A [Candidatus Firestonebacteria bacterium]
MNFIKALSTGLYLGYFPIFPGTIGSLLGMLVYLLVGKNRTIFFITLFFLLTVGTFSAIKTQLLFKSDDPPEIVIDEITGFFISVAFLPFKLWITILAFVIFRILDILKPYPISFFHKTSSKFGIMADDIVAGAFTFLIMFIILKIF